MDSRILAVLSSPQLLAAREYHTRRLQALYFGDRLDAPMFLCGINGHGREADRWVDWYQEPELWVMQMLQNLAEQAGKLLDRRVYRPLVVESALYGVHFIDKIFGADVFYLPTDDKLVHWFDWFGLNWQARTLGIPVGSLEIPDLANDPTWALARRVAETFVASGVTVPFFALPTIASPLNIAINLFGQDILLAMLTDPDAARHDLRVILDVQVAVHRWYREHIPAEQLQLVVGAHRTQPPGFGQLCGCSVALISQRQYAEFIAPLDDELLSVYPHGGMIHLCGASAQHIPTFRAMRSLRAIQMNDRAIDDLEQYFRELREDQIFYCSPYDKMSLERIMQITGGHRTVICADVKEPLPVRA